MRKKKDDSEAGAPVPGRYDEELLSANWNPVIDLLEWSCAKTLHDMRADSAKDLSDEEIDALLARIYALGG